MSPKIGRPQSNNSKTERIYIRVTPSEKEEIKRICKKHECSISDLIRKGINALE